MHLNFAPSYLAGVLGFDFRIFIAIIIPLAGITLAGVITVSAMYFQNRRREMWHQTARLALEKGQPLPASLGEKLDRTHTFGERHEGKRNDIRVGLILMGVGFGLFLFFMSVGATPVRYVGAIPGFIGVALLVNGLLDAKLSRNKPTLDDRSAQP